MYLRVKLTVADVDRIAALAEAADTSSDEIVSGIVKLYLGGGPRAKDDRAQALVEAVVAAVEVYEGGGRYVDKTKHDQILELHDQNRTNREIAKALGVSASTVSRHLHRP